ncbi:MAG: efflux RND transporter periplasmic adaptor subunit [Pseudomonadota bacterium]
MKFFKRNPQRHDFADDSRWNGTHRRMAALLFALLAAAGCSEKIEPGNTAGAKGPAVPVTVVTVRQELQPVVYEAVGTVKAKVSATVSSKLMGIIRAFQVAEGDRVSSGDVLVVLDERQVSAQLSQAKAALAEAQKAKTAALSAQQAAEADAQRALLAYRRGRTMLDGGAITQESFETVDAQYKQAQAALSQAKAMVDAASSRIHQAQGAVDAAAVALKDARVLAPFDGKVTAKLADAGGLAAPGTPLLTIERESGYRVDLAVPETYIHSVHIDQPVNVRIPAVNDLTLTGTVDVIIPSADQSSRTFIVQVGVGDPSALKSGMFARVPLTIGEKRMIRIPGSAVVRQGQLTGVFMVDGEKTARFRLIRLGRTYGDQVEVISGLHDGALLVAAPESKVSNGSPVEFDK